MRAALPRDWPKPEAVVHLAAIVGFPACQAVGKQAAWRYNVEAVKHVFELAAGFGSERFVFASTYSNYGLSLDGKPVTEDLAAQSAVFICRDKNRCRRVSIGTERYGNCTAYLPPGDTLWYFSAHPF